MAMPKGKTPFMKAEGRVVAQFAAKVEALGLGLKANSRSLGGMYAADGIFVLDLQTEPEPLKGNKGKVEALRSAGYVVDVYAPMTRAVTATSLLMPAAGGKSPPLIWRRCRGANVGYCGAGVPDLNEND